MEARARVFVSIKTKDIAKAYELLKTKYENVKEENGYIKVYDVFDTENIVETLIQNGHIVSEVEKNKIGLEEYYIELMSKKEEK